MKCAVCTEYIIIMCIIIMCIIQQLTVSATMCFISEAEGGQVETVAMAKYKKDIWA